MSKGKHSNKGAIGKAESVEDKLYAAIWGTLPEPKTDAAAAAYRGTRRQMHYCEHEKLSGVERSEFLEMARLFNNALARGDADFFREVAELVEKGLPTGTHNMTGILPLDYVEPSYPGAMSPLDAEILALLIETECGSKKDHPIVKKHWPMTPRELRAVLKKRGIEGPLDDKTLKPAAQRCGFPLSDPPKGAPKRQAD